MLDIGAIESTRASHWPVAGGEDHRLAAPGMDGVADGLRPRPLFDEREIAAGVVGAGLAQEADGLQRERQVAIKVLMQAVVAARLVVQQEGVALRCPAAWHCAVNCASPAGNRISSPSASPQRLTMAASGG